MNTVDVNKRLVDSYLELFENLTRSSKQNLISGLSDSLKSDKALNNQSLKSLWDFVPEKTADELIDELKEARHFTRKIEPF